MTKLTLSLLARILELLCELNEARQLTADLKEMNHKLLTDLHREIRKSNADAARLQLQSRS